MKGIKRKILICGIVFSAITATSMSVYATEAPTLSEAINSESNNTVDSLFGSSDSEQRQEVRETVKDFNVLSEAGKVDINNEKSVAIFQSMKKLLTPFMYVIVWAIVLGINLTSLMDLLYLSVPLSRSLLCKDPSSVPGTQAPQGGGSSGGFGGGGFGGGGFGGGGFGGSSFGGSSFGGSGYGSSGFGGSSFGGGGSQQPQGRGKNQLISASAIKAVNCHGQMGPDGVEMSMWKVYGKHLICLMVLAPILLILTIDGVLVDISTTLAALLITGIRTILGGI